MAQIFLGGFFIRRLRRFTQIMAVCLAAARQATPPVFCQQIKADSRRLVCVSRAGAKVGFFIRRLRRFTQIMAVCLAAARQATPPVFYPQITPIGADFFFWGGYPQITPIGADFWRPVLPLRVKSRRRFLQVIWQ
ncbi:MAG: hypothetical protein ACOX9E_02265 [Lentisphaeria bacterium]